MEYSKESNKHPLTADRQAAINHNILNQLNIHPLRETLYNELHNRPFHLLSSPAQLSHIGIHHGGKLRQEEHRFISALCNRFQVSAPAESMPCFHQQFATFSLRWERHLEYSTYTFIHEAPQTAQPFVKNAIDYVPVDWLHQIPGDVITALHLLVEPGSDSNNGRPLAQCERNISAYFDNLRLVGSAPVDGQAEVWTSFRLHEGFGRFLVYENGLSPAELGRLVQRLLELETYRLMATMGLPLAQTINSDLTRIDLKLKQLTARIAEQQKGLPTDGDRGLLKEVTSLAATIEDYRAQSNYRFAATSAYYDVILQRMAELKEQEIPGYLTLSEFLTRRIAPAVKTCQTVAALLEDTSRRITRASDLLRTRVDTVQQEQNQELLKSMNRRAQIQLHLQQTVEGLSVAAISYYAIQLLDVVLDSVQSSGIGFNRGLLLGFSVPLVICTVFFTTRLIHRRLLKDLQ